MLLLEGELAVAEPKKLRYRLLHLAARITRSAAAQFNQGSRPGPLHQFQHSGHLRLHRRGCPTRHPQSRPGSSR